jgi:hypothetical protein
MATTTCLPGLSGPDCFSRTPWRTSEMQQLPSRSRPKPLWSEPGSFAKPSTASSSQPQPKTATEEGRHGHHPYCLPRSDRPCHPQASQPAPGLGLARRHQRPQPAAVADRPRRRRSFQTASLQLLAQCQHCRWLFLDTSRQHNRRWCSMNACGAIMKMRRYRAAHRP